jgi:hypothetical protein
MKPGLSRAVLAMVQPRIRVVTPAGVSHIRLRDEGVFSAAGLGAPGIFRLLSRHRPQTHALVQVLQLPSAVAASKSLRSSDNLHFYESTCRTDVRFASSVLSARRDAVADSMPPSATRVFRRSAVVAKQAVSRLPPTFPGAQSGSPRYPKKSSFGHVSIGPSVLAVQSVFPASPSNDRRSRTSG